jgi:phosphinothricin acetyltransferase
MLLRPARMEDGAALCAIYRPYVMETAITFICKEPTAESFSEKIKSLIPQYPFIVCEENGKALGYAYASALRPHDAYQWDAELSVYVDRNLHGRGIGRKLYAALLELLKVQGYQTVYGVISLPNEKSLALHAAFGFETLGVFPKSGHKLGRWHDIIWLQKTLGEFPENPVPPTPFSKLSPETIQKVLETNS